MRPWQLRVLGVLAGALGVANFLTGNVELGGLLLIAQAIYWWWADWKEA